RLMVAFGMAIVVIIPTFAAGDRSSVLAPFGIGLATFVMIGAVIDIVERIGLFRVSFSIARQRAAGLPRSAWGTALAHFGVAVTLLGIVCVTAWATERIVALTPSETVSISGYELTFDGTVQRSGPNFSESAAKFTSRNDDVPLGVI